MLTYLDDTERTHAHNTLKTAGDGDGGSPEYTLTSECTLDLPSSCLKS